MTCLYFAAAVILLGLVLAVLALFEGQPMTALSIFLAGSFNVGYRKFPHLLIIRN